VAGDCVVVVAVGLGEGCAGVVVVGVVAGGAVGVVLAGGAGLVLVAGGAG